MSNLSSAFLNQSQDEGKLFRPYFGRRRAMGQRLKDKVAVITGASSGIGRATALLFAAEGAKLVLGDVAQDALEETAAMVRSHGGDVVAKQTDVSMESDVKGLIDLAMERFSTVDVLCNNAGITGDLVDVEDFDGDMWNKVLQVNLIGAAYGIKHVAGPMRKKHKGSIVNTSSVAGIRSGAGGNAYSASKAALINLTMTAACDLGKDNIRVNAVCPGLVETGMTQPVFDYARKIGKEDKLGNRCELRRYGRPEEVGWAILFLASDESSYITGQALPVDGGNTASLNLPGMKV
jgi:meso-butanediol dehydrogenase / (S,S)-butanediol dehydrogenase / diacetyl reductase